jgi:hypothetical protein
MTEAIPITCSLGAGDLKQRLADITAIGEESLIDYAAASGRHVLRFRSDAATRKRLEQIVAAEKRCCPFLDLSLEGRAGELILSITSPRDSRGVADELARAFVSVSER